MQQNVDMNGKISTSKQLTFLYTKEYDRSNLIFYLHNDLCTAWNLLKRMFAYYTARRTCNPNLDTLVYFVYSELNKISRWFRGWQGIDPKYTLNTTAMNQTSTIDLMHIVHSNHALQSADHTKYRHTEYCDEHLPLGHHAQHIICCINKSKHFLLLSAQNTPRCYHTLPPYLLSCHHELCI